MQKAILVAHDGTMVEKCVYAGDVSDPVMQREKDRLQALHPDCDVTIFDSDEDPDFVAA